MRLFLTGNHSIKSNSNLHFYVIVNPDSGPGTSGSQPDSNYQACIASLRTAGTADHNVLILGYVPTGYGSDSSSGVISSINTYSGWSSSYRPDGIFFDEVATTASALPTYQTYSSQVHTDFGTSFVSLLFIEI